MPDVVLVHFVWNRRSRTNYAHIAAKHIDQLWKLIKTCSPQPSANASDPRIISNFSVYRLFVVAGICFRPAGDILLIGFSMNRVVRVGTHRTKLKTKKDSAVHSYPFLSEKYRAGRITFDK